VYPPPPQNFLFTCNKTTFTTFLESKYQIISLS
jgi:hypothetical protein